MPTVRAPFTLAVDDRDPILVLDVVELNAPPVEYVRSLRAVLPDPAWRHVDEHGHEHRWAHTGRGVFGHADALPTLEGSRVPVACDGSCGTPLPPEPDSGPEPPAGADLLARLDWLVAGPGSDGDVSDDRYIACEGYDVTLWHCRACGEQVEPGTIPDRQAMTTGVPVQVGPATATIVVESDLSDLDGRVIDAVLRAADGTEMRGKAHVIDGQVRYGPDGIKTRVTIEMAILDEPVRR